MIVANAILAALYWLGMILYIEWWAVRPPKLPKEPHEPDPDPPPRGDPPR